MEPTEVHASAQRLLEAAIDATSQLPRSRQIHDLSGVRKALNMTPQGLNNWKLRPVSKEQALAAEALWGCPASWVLTGERPPRWPSSAAPALQPMGLDAALEVIGIALAAVPHNRREAVAINLSGWAREGGADHYRGTVESLLSTATQKGKQQDRAA